MSFASETKRELQNNTLTSLILYSVGFFLTSIFCSDGELVWAQAILIWICAVYGVITLLMLSDNDKNLAAYLVPAFVPIGSTMVALSRKGVILPGPHMLLGLLILTAIFLASVRSFKKELAWNGEEAAVIGTFFTCFAGLFLIPYLLVTYLK